MGNVDAGRTDPTPRLPVLIVGTGPTGLVLATWLNRLGVKFRIIDKSDGPGTTSRAMAVQARTLEFYRQIGLADLVVAGGMPIAGVNLWGRGRKVMRLPLAEIGQGMSPFPFVLDFPQDAHEKLLVDHLDSQGVQVERSTELLRGECLPDRILATIKRPDGSEVVCEASYLAGCDGAHSMVRTCLGIGLPGGTYEGHFFVADVEASGPPIDHEIHVDLDDGDFVGIFPLQDDGRVRLIGAVKEEAEVESRNLSFEDISGRAIENMKLSIHAVHWFSTYRVHHRVADHFREGRAFLLGDAAHLHSPVGGQGMNTGIGDAVNLAWKLAAVVDGKATEEILDSYEVERIAFARRLVATTDRIFTLVTKAGSFAEFIRLKLVPLVLPQLLSSARSRRFAFRTVSQIGIEYRSSPLSEGVAGEVHGGDRLPWVPEANGTEHNFDPLRSIDWQVHVYGEPSAGLTEICRELGLPLHAFPWTSAISASGLAQDAVYLVRPDGYVALADSGADPDRLKRYFQSRSLSPGQEISR